MMDFDDWQTFTTSHIMSKRATIPYKILMFQLWKKINYLRKQTFNVELGFLRHPN